MKYFTQFVNEPVALGESGFSDSMVEIKGYRTTRQQVECMLVAGRNLVFARAEQFDYDADDDSGVDGTLPLDRNKDFDLADVPVITEYLSDKAAAAQHVDDKSKNDNMTAHADAQSDKTSDDASQQVKNIEPTGSM